mmetsp:Transcript_73340/g.228803  ORF Transcript_73340/g.228803 Transcript_73340/m.228803 type:complete len:186 (+) Transcript_73340:241-798(+)
MPAVLQGTEGLRRSGRLRLWSRCKGIEYSPSGRCEVWIRPGGIQATRRVPGFVCLRYRPSAFVPAGGGQDWACRGATSADNSPEYYVLARGVRSLDACEALCEGEAQCKGIEYSQLRGRCEVWTRPGGVRATAAVAGHSCYTYAPPPAQGKARMAVRQHKFLANALLQTGVASSRLEPADMVCEA